MSVAKSVKGRFRRLLASGGGAALAGTLGLVGSWVPSSWQASSAVERICDLTSESIAGDLGVGKENLCFRLRDLTAREYFSDRITLVPGHEYEALAYFRTDTANPLEGQGQKPQGFYIRTEIPEVVPAESLGIMNAVIESSSGDSQVWDEVHVENAGTGDIALRYVPNSARVGTDYFSPVGDSTRASVSLVELTGPQGALIPENVGGTSYPYASGYATFRVVADYPDFEVYFQSRKAGSGEWGESVDASVGDRVEFRIEYRNTGSVKQSPVTVNVKLPEGLSYVEGSSLFANSNTEGAYKDVGHDHLISNGVKIGAYSGTTVVTSYPRDELETREAGGGNIFIKFAAQVDESALLLHEDTLVVDAFANTHNGAKRDTAVVRIIDTSDSTVTTPLFAALLVLVGLTLPAAWLIRNARRLNHQKVGATSEPSH